VRPADSPEEAKRRAGVRAAAEVGDGMVLGLGTGSTVAFFLEALAARIAREELRGVRGVPTSEWTARRCRELGVPLLSLEEAGMLDLAVDGADEVDPGLDLVKGLGGALLREKIVAQAARRFLVIVDRAKLVERLGTRSPLPLEVVPFGWGVHVPFLETLGAEVEVRTTPGGEPFRTDNGNLILDCTFPGGIADARSLAAALQGRAGIVEHGLFLGMADRVLVGGAGGVDVLERKER